jgi:Flp pilus assembly protein TadG
MTGASSELARHRQARRPAGGGQATVELALVLPTIVMLILCVVQVGAVVRDRLLLAHVAREAARAAAVEPQLAPALAAAREASGLDPDRLTVHLGGGQASGDRLIVTVAYLAPTDVPIVGSLLPDLSLRTEVTIRVE